MIPLRDDVSSRSVPMVTIGLIVINVLVYLYELSLGAGGREPIGPGAAEAFVLEFGATPCRLSGACAAFDDFPGPVVTVFTSMFMHSLNPVHIVGNMLYLWIFGNNVEDTLGHGRFLVFYLLAGVAAAITQTLSAPRSAVPIIGAITDSSARSCSAARARAVSWSASTSGRAARVARWRSCTSRSSKP